MFEVLSLGLHTGRKVLSLNGVGQRSLLNGIAMLRKSICSVVKNRSKSQSFHRLLEVGFNLQPTNVIASELINRQANTGQPLMNKSPKHTARVIMFDIVSTTAAKQTHPIKFVESGIGVDTVQNHAESMKTKEFGTAFLEMLYNRRPVNMEVSIEVLDAPLAEELKKSHWMNSIAENGVHGFLWLPKFSYVGKGGQLLLGPFEIANV